MKNFWRKASAFALSLVLVGAGVPALTSAKVINDTAITASAFSTKKVSYEMEFLHYDFFTINVDLKGSDGSYGVIRCSGDTFNDVTERMGNINIHMTGSDIKFFDDGITGKNIKVSFEGASNDIKIVSTNVTSEKTDDGYDKITKFEVEYYKESEKMLSGDGSQSNPYIIANESEWDIFCDNLANNDKSYSTGKFFRLDSDISVSRYAGGAYHDFCGTFDGNGHTIDFNYAGSEEFIAPFSFAEGNACIKNLRTTGTINTSAKYAAGIISNGFGNVTLENCRSSVTINSSVNGDGTHAGLVSVVQGNYTINNCLFDGAFNGSSTSCWGGFVGWRNGSVSITNSIFAPSYVNVNKSGSATFVRNGSVGNSCSYSVDLGGNQGGYVNPDMLKFIIRLRFGKLF